jgi:hypothetical protein
LSNVIQNPIFSLAKEEYLKYISIGKKRQAEIILDLMAESAKTKEEKSYMTEIYKNRNKNNK